MGWLDFIFPKQCVACSRLGSYLCPSCLSKIEYLETQMCAYCYRPSISGLTHPKCAKTDGLDGVVSLTNYQTPIREVIKSLKYRFATDVLAEFSDKLVFKLELIVENDATLVPLPLYQTRQNFRGFNQAELLGKLVAEKMKLKYRDDLVVRTRATKSQVGLSQKDRTENMRAAFSVADKLDSENYYIFDDVWTSGASLKAVATVLKKAGAETVWGLTLAHPR